VYSTGLQLAAAIYWYQRGQISQELAAQVARLDRTDFLMALAREGVDAFTVDFHDLERELDLADPPARRRLMRLTLPWA
jgi:predicted HTH domain antitoxin